MWQASPSHFTRALFLSPNLELGLLKQRLLTLASPLHRTSFLCLLILCFLNSREKSDFSYEKLYLLYLHTLVALVVRNIQTQCVSTGSCYFKNK